MILHLSEHNTFINRIEMSLETALGIAKSRKVYKSLGRINENDVNPVAIIEACVKSC